jgi:hypothetical protein
MKQTLIALIVFFGLLAAAGCEKTIKEVRTPANAPTAAALSR